MSWMEDAGQLWRLVAQYLPERPPRPPGRAGRAWIPDERVFMRLVLFLRAGCSWEVFDELSKGCGVSGRTVRNRLADWRRTGVFEQVYDVLRRKLYPSAVAHLDAMFVRARYSGDLVGLTRHGRGSKLQALVNDNSMPLAIQLKSANPHEAKITPALLDLVDKMPDVVVADKAYDLDELRDEFAERTSKLLAPHRSNRKKPPRDQEQIGCHYKQRWRVERLFAWLVGWRRLATRWEADSLNYNTWICLATSLIYVRGGLLP
ncbi:MAG: IS5 family transposase [Chloroflexota bacterium]|nr:IS5 family transposase [Chloroflexota bacterium]